MRALCFLHRVTLTDFCVLIVQLMPEEHLVDIETLNDSEDAERLFSMFFARIEDDLRARHKRQFISSKQLF